MLGRIYQADNFEGKDLNKAEKFYKEAKEHGYIYGLQGLSRLEKEKGNWIKGFYYQAKVAVLVFRIALKNPNDLRLRPG